MKKTNFCFSFPMGNLQTNIKEPGVLIYNAFTNALAAIETSKYQAYSDFCAKGTEIADQQLIADLKKGGFLIDDDFDEIAKLRHRLLSRRYQSSHFALTIAPTSDCNFRCIYCYEKDRLRPSYMNQEVVDHVISWLKTRVQEIKTFSVTWYGGEPLLAVDTIDKLSTEFQSICKENHIQYFAGIITNGSLLTREIVKRLNELDVNFYQITVDGSKATHNQRRPLKGGGETYDLILKKIEECYDLLPTVSLRINVDKDNVSAADDIRKILHERNLHEKVVPYLGKITNDNNDPELSRVCLSTKEFTEHALLFAESVETKNGATTSTYPVLKGSFCGADSINSYVVDSDGLVYKCWNDIGNPDKAIWNILTDEEINYCMQNAYLSHDPTSDPDCSKCKLLPICMGGCPHQRLDGVKEERCSQYKYALNKFIMKAAEQIVANREKTLLETLEANKE